MYFSSFLAIKIYQFFAQLSLFGGKKER